MTISMGCVTIDCVDPLPLAEFWNSALGWGGAATTEEGHGAVCGPADGGIYLEFVKVPETKTIKNRLHLGCAATSLIDLDAEIERLLSLGASIAWEEEFPAEIAGVYRNVILRDPEGNEFCLGGGDYPA